jgi:hypothetical protein
VAAARLKGEPMSTEPNRYQGGILWALNRMGKHIYGGTVPPAEAHRRLKAAKAAKAARKIQRRAK